MTRPIGPPFTAAMAVAAMVTFRSYGADVHFVPSDPLPGVRTAYRLVTTPVVAAGSWSVTIAVQVDGSAQGTDIAVDIEVDGIPLGVVLSEASVVGGGFLLAGVSPVVWSAGAHTIEYFVWHPSGPGTAAARSALTSWVREV